MKKLMLIFVLMTFPLFGANFDCIKAKSDVEKAICQDDELSKLDEALDSAYKEALIDGTYYDQYNPDIQKIKQAQREWVKERNTCSGDIDCLIEKYNSRLSELTYDRISEKPPIELSSVKYTLIVNENNAMCSHLLELYNHDIEQFQKVSYDNHIEFNWLKWEVPIKDVPTADKIIGGAFFDINNDGKEDFIFGWHVSMYGFLRERYDIYDNNVSEFFRHQLKFNNDSKEWKEYVISIENQGNTFGRVPFDLISNQLTKLPPYTIREIQNAKKKHDELIQKNVIKDSIFTWSFTDQKNEIRFLKWNDGKFYIVFDGSNRFRDRNQYNLVGYIQPDYVFNPQCLFYKKIR